MEKNHITEHDNNLRCFNNSLRIRDIFNEDDDYAHPEVFGHLACKLRQGRELATLPHTPLCQDDKFPAKLLKSSYLAWDSKKFKTISLEMSLGKLCPENLYPPFYFVRDSSNNKPIKDVTVGLSGRRY